MADEDAEYDSVVTIDLSTLAPTVACPHLPENTKTVDELSDVKIDQVVIGSCTNGRIEDMRTAAEILRVRRLPTAFAVSLFLLLKAFIFSA